MAQGGRNTYQTYRESLSGDYSVLHKRTYSNEKSQFHIHNEFEVLLSLSAGLKLDTGSKTYILPHYSLMLFSNMDLHLLSLMSPNTENDRYVMYFKPEYINGLSTENTDLLECFMLRPFPNANILSLDATTANGLAETLDRVIALQSSQGEIAYGGDLQIKLLLAQYLLDINRLYRKHHGFAIPTTSRNYRNIYTILNYMHLNYFEDVGLDQLARQFFINKYTMCTLFREITGMSPLQYLINCRLMKARELLLHGMAVEEVCGRVGYNNLSHFSRAFKSKVGVSPKQYQMNGIGSAPRRR